MDSGTMEKLVVLGSSFMPMETFTKENSQTIRQTDRGHTIIRMALNTTANGGKISKTAMAKKNGKTEHFMRASSKMGRRVGRVFTDGRMQALTKELGKKTVLMDMALISGLTEGDTQANGR